jgi:adenosylcobinamide-GDP ribazoletransferase
MTLPGADNDPDRSWGEWLAERVHELSAGILFSTRLPLGRAHPITAGEIARAAWAFPLAGIVVGVIGAVIYALADRIGLPPWPAAALAVAATLAVTGALHEDGLADTADGFGGGATRKQKLGIMREPRAGVYGVCALIVSILLRAGALASLADPALVAAALIAAHAAARAAMPVVMFFVPPARSDGLSFDAGTPARENAAAAAVLGFLILAGCLGFVPAVVAAILLAIAVVLMARLSLAQIGGQTGDVLGAIEQVSEIVILLVAVG